MLDGVSEVISNVVCKFPRCARDDGKVMRKFFTLLSREIRSYFYSPIAYIVLVFFLVVSGVDFYFQISFMNQRPVSYTVQEKVSAMSKWGGSR